MTEIPVVDASSLFNDDMRKEWDKPKVIMLQSSDNPPCHGTRLRKMAFMHDNRIVRAWIRERIREYCESDEYPHCPRPALYADIQDAVRGKKDWFVPWDEREEEEE